MIDPAEVTPRPSLSCRSPKHAHEYEMVKTTSAIGATTFGYRRQKPLAPVPWLRRSCLSVSSQMICRTDQRADELSGHVTCGILAAPCASKPYARRRWPVDNGSQNAAEYGRPSPTEAECESYRQYASAVRHNLRLYAAHGSPSGREPLVPVSAKYFFIIT